MSGFSSFGVISALFVTLAVDFVVGSDSSSNGQGSSSSYDFIIVGAGSAGSIVAAELAKEFPRMSILLVEEGYYGKINPDIEDMSKWPDMVFNPTIERLYKTVPQPNLDNREIDIQRSKVTGGCNSHNAQVYIWANEQDFERWGNINGWTLDDLLPLWDELESVTFNGFTSTLGETWMNRVIDASGVLGYSFNENWNDLKDGKTQEGITYIPKQSKLINDSYIERHSSWTDYVEPVLKSCDNLDIKVFKRVNKVLLSKNNDKAIGIEIEDIGTLKKEIIYAREEVILSASIIDSPKILLLSGIGDCNELSNVNIECKKHLPGVGKGLQDHVIVRLISPPVLNKTQVLSQIPNYFGATAIFGAGLVTENSDHHWHIFFQEIESEEEDGEAGEAGDDDTYVTLSIIVINNRIQSEGTVKLLDNNPESLPIVDFNYLDNPDDIKLVIKSFKQAREFLYDTGVFDGLFESKENEIDPGYDISSDEEIDDWLRREGIGFFPGAHSGGTCRMTDDIYDEYGVVNERLQVKGIRKLRIVDSSIMPKVVSANSNQMAMMIGLKASKMIVEDHPHCK